MMGSGKGLHNDFPPERKYLVKIVKRNIRNEIDKRNLTITAVCARMMHNPQYITSLNNPSIGNIIRISKAIGCDISKLLKGVTLKDFGQEEG